MGDVVDDYVGGHLDRAYRRPGSLYISEVELKTALPGEGEKLVDAILCHGDTVVLLENKANALTLGIRAGDTPAEYDRKTKDIFLDAAEQTGRVIESIRAGRLLSAGLDPATINTYVPVVLTLEEIPSNPLLLQRIIEHTQANGLLLGTDVLRFQTITLSEFLQLEAEMDGGVAPEEALRQKSSSDVWWGVSFQNFCLATHRRSGHSTSNWFAERYSQITSQVSGVFAARTREPASNDRVAPPALPTEGDVIAEGSS
jgi:hypothetical protein